MAIPLDMLTCVVGSHTFRNEVNVLFLTAESGSKHKVTGAQNATLGPSAPTIASSLDFFGPLLSHNWVARKFKEANTVVASLSTASCDAGLHHFCWFACTQVQSIPLARELSPLSDVTRNRAQTGRILQNVWNVKMTTISAVFLDGFHREYCTEKNPKKYFYTVLSQEIIET